MKFLMAIILGLVALNVYSVETKSASPAEKKSRFFYLEFHNKVTIQAIKCDPNANELSIQKFASQSVVKNGEVNIINLYARSADCRESPYSSVWQESIELPKNGKHTHVYITILSENVSVLSL